MAQYNHDPKKINLILGGIPIEGFMEGSGITLEPDSDISTTSMGVDKDSTRKINSNISWSLNFTIQNGSPSNDVLNSLIRTQASTPFLLKDANTLNTQAVGICYPKALPSISGELEAGGREYQFTAVDVNINYGGAS
jgi:hypothetical protein